MPAEGSFDPERILRVLNARGVGYVVVGGFAVAAHGVVRATADLDLVVERSWANAARFAAALEELGATDATGAETPLTPEVLVRRTDRKVLTHHGAVHVLSEVEGVPAYRDLVPATGIRLGGETVAVSTLADLRAMKRTADRPKDRFDLLELDALHGPDAVLPKPAPSPALQCPPPQEPALPEEEDERPSGDLPRDGETPPD
jgi:hypothetical protein